MYVCSYIHANLEQTQADTVVQTYSATVGHSRTAYTDSSYKSRIIIYIKTIPEGASPPSLLLKTEIHMKSRDNSLGGGAMGWNRDL